MPTLRLLPILALATLGGCRTALEIVPQLPDGWRLMDDEVDPDRAISISLALHEPKISELPNKLLSYPIYQMSVDEARDLRTPDQEDIDKVQQWLTDNGILKSWLQDDWIHIQTTVGQIESLLNMKLHLYKYENNEPVFRTTEYSVPDNLAEGIRFVHPIANFMTPTKQLLRPSPPITLHKRQSNSPCASVVTPHCIRKMYNYPALEIDSSSSIRIGVAGFLEQYANYEDLEAFLNLMAPEIGSTSYNFTVELINGGENSQDPNLSGQEAALDIDYTMALGYPADVVYYSTGGRGVKLGPDGKPLEGDFDNEPFLDLLEHLLAKPDDEIPHVLSVSYADDELTVPQPYAERVCSMLGLLTARGTSILVASGDGGAAGSRNSGCKDYEGKPVTMAVFPATCPWVTAVGGVRNDVEPTTGAIFSGGGFSQYFAMPDWQKEEVNGYVLGLKSHLTGYYSTSMRAIPDISAVATRFFTITGQKYMTMEGTSASAPLLATVIALANDARVKTGKPVLGWLNKHLYSEDVRGVLEDVTWGTSKACPFETQLSDGGWLAKGGWDAITGLGVPNDVQAFIDVLKNI